MADEKKYAHLFHKRSVASDPNDEKLPKLPTSDQILHGEIAVNFGEGHEALSIKNNDDKVVYIPFNLTERMTTQEETVGELSGDTENKLSDVRKSIGLNDDYTFSPSGSIINSETTVSGAVNKLSENAENISNSLGFVNNTKYQSSISALNGLTVASAIDETYKHVDGVADGIKAGLGLGVWGDFNSDGQYTSGSTNMTDAIETLDSQVVALNTNIISTVGLDDNLEYNPTTTELSGKTISEAIDATYDYAKKVKLTGVDDVVVNPDTQEVGTALANDIKVYGIPENGIGSVKNNTVLSKGSSLSDILKMMLQTLMYPKTATLPSVSLSNPTINSVVEIGNDIIVPSVTMTENAGKFNADYTNVVQPTPNYTTSNQKIQILYGNSSSTTPTTSVAEIEGKSTSEVAINNAKNVNRIDIVASENYSAPNNKPVRNDDVETTKTSETAEEGTATWKAGTASATKSFIVNGVYRMYTNGKEISINAITAAAQNVPNAVQTNSQIALTTGSTFAVAFFSEAEKKTHFEVYLYDKQIVSVLSLNALNGKWETEFTSDFYKKGVKTINGLTYDVWSTKDGTDLQGTYYRGSEKLLFTTTDKS